MIKYRINGKFLTEKGNVQNICSEFFKDSENPFLARNNAKKYFSNFKDLLLIDFKIDFKSTFNKKIKFDIDNKIHELDLKYGIALEFTFDEIDYFQIDYFGIYNNDFIDSIALGLQTEFDYFEENSFYFENSRQITFCNMGEWIEGHTEDEPSSFKILETSIEFDNKNKPYWWLNNKEKREFIQKIVEENQIEKAFVFGENSFIEFKPALLYNFKTKQASIGVKNIIAKVICSFLNSNGGKLLIGINDNGEIQGLENDFSLTNKKNKYDFFRLEFDNLLYQFFDKSVLNYIIADFNTNREEIFFEISIKPSDIPFFLLNKKENTKEFYIRSIASSLIINDIEEVVKYCLKHWKK